MKSSLLEVEKKSGRANMQVAAITSRFLTRRSSKAGIADSKTAVGSDGLLGHVLASSLITAVSSRQQFLTLSNSLIQAAEQAYLIRDFDSLAEVSRVLMNLPSDAVRQIGLYYHALAINRKGDFKEAQTLLERLSNTAPPSYRARAIQTLGANYHDKGQLDEALRYQREATRAAPNKNAEGLQTILRAYGEIATIRSISGDHEGALADLENLWPLVDRVSKQSPFFFYVYYNELAVEFAEVGRLGEAEAAVSIALASPFAAAYPEWSETREEIAAKRVSATPSVVAVSRPSEAQAARNSNRSPRTRPQSQPKPTRALPLNWRAFENSFLQRASVTNVDSSTIVRGVTIRSAIDQVLTCRGPRAPPAF
ncbi:MAG TPA: hypothetical protein VLM38_06605 [Blastocatellia bacterium]|nr:hypothetical protein [Blastocatellia bacterium]